MSRQKPEKLIGVLFIENSIGLSGSTISLCTLLNYLDPAVFEAHIVLSRAEQESHLLGHLRRPAALTVIAPRRSLKHAPFVQRTLDRLGGRHPRVHRLVRRIASLFDLAIVTIPYAWRLYQWARARRIKLIHQNNGFDLASVILSKLLRVPLIAYQRGDEWNSPAVRWLASGVRHYIANSATTLASLTSLGISSRRVSLIYPPLDLHVFDDRRPAALTRSSLGLEPSALCFAIVGLLVPWKGHIVFLKAARRVLDHLPDARAVIVGAPPDGDERYADELKALARDLGIADRVVFTGFRADVPEILKLMDILVHASVFPEPFGRVIIEAMAMRRPVVASRAGGPLEIIEDGRNGFLVPPDDDETLAGRVIELLEDRTLSARIADAAYLDVESRFSAEKHSRDVQQVYETVLSPKSGAIARERRADRARRTAAMRKET